MKIKNLLLALLALPLLFVGCKNSDPVVDETPEIKQPTVAVTAGEATENTITFTITSTDADKVAYVVVEGTEEPTASEVLSNGTEVDANKAVTLTASELEAETEYTIVAAAKNSSAVVKASATKKTLAEGDEPEPEPEPEPGDPKEWKASYFMADFDDSEGINIYAIILGDKEFGDSGWGVDGGTYYSVYFVSSSKGNGKLPNGIYTLDSTYTPGTIIEDYSFYYIMENGEPKNGFELFKSANLTVSDGKVVLDVELAKDGSVHKVVYEGDLSVEDGTSGTPDEFEATHVADKWYWGGSSMYGNKYSVSGENFSVDVHFQPKNATEEAIVAGEYIWTTTTMWGYNDFEEFTTRTFTVDGTSVAVDGGIAVVSNEGEEYHIEMTLQGRDGFVYMIEYNGKINDKGNESGDTQLAITKLSEGTYNSSYYFYTFKAQGDNFSFDLVVNDYQAKENKILAGSYQGASSISMAGNEGYFYANNFKYDGVSYKPAEASTMVVEGDGTNVNITMNLTMQSGDKFVVTYAGTIGESASGEPTKLATPSVSGLVAGNAATVSWNAIAGAKDYTVTLNGTDVQTVETAYIVYQNLEYSTTYTVSVVANPADAAANLASDAGTATFTTEADPGTGGGDDSGDDNEDDGQGASATLKFVKDYSEEYGSDYSILCYYEITSGDDVIGFTIFNNKSDRTSLYDGTYNHVSSLNSLIMNQGSAIVIDKVVIDGVDNGGAQSSSTLKVEGSGATVTLKLDYNVINVGVESRTYVCNGISL